MSYTPRPCYLLYEIRSLNFPTCSQTWNFPVTASQNSEITDGSLHSSSPLFFWCWPFCWHLPSCLCQGSYELGVVYKSSQFLLQDHFKSCSSWLKFLSVSSISAGLLFWPPSWFWTNSTHSLFNSSPVLVLSFPAQCLAVYGLLIGTYHCANEIRYCVCSSQSIPHPQQHVSSLKTSSLFMLFPGHSAKFLGLILCYLCHAFLRDIHVQGLVGANVQRPASKQFWEASEFHNCMCVGSGLSCICAWVSSLFPGLFPPPSVVNPKNTFQKISAPLTSISEFISQESQHRTSPDGPLKWVFRRWILACNYWIREWM